MNICGLQPHAEDLKVAKTKTIKKCATFKFTKEWNEFESQQDVHEPQMEITRLIGIVIKL
jgi:hypothetical protein